MPRHSCLALVVIKLRIDGGDHLLLRVHRKWGDFSLVGGHVEAGEEGDWRRAAIREAEEELDPLRHEDDFRIVRLLDESVRWGPVQSRSARGQATYYEAQYFLLEFVGDPAAALARLPASDFLLIPLNRLDGGAATSETVGYLSRSYPGGLRGLPLSHAASIRGADLEVKVQTTEAPGRFVRWEIVPT